MATFRPSAPFSIWLMSRSAASPPIASLIWQTVRSEAELRRAAEPALTSFFHTSLLEHENLAGALSHILALKLDSAAMPSVSMVRILRDAFFGDAKLEDLVLADLEAVRQRDPACRYYSTPLLFYKGFQALQTWRLANWYWSQQRHSLALFLQSRISDVFGVDIHPAASIGKGVMIDHATGVVIGETAVIEDDVSIYQGVTLGWNGRDRGVRHPRIRRGALISAGAQVLGHIEVGEKARIAAGAVVIADVAPGMTVAGVPAQEVSGPHSRFWWEEIPPSAAGKVKAAAEG